MTEYGAAVTLNLKDMDLRLIDSVACQEQIVPAYSSMALMEKDYSELTRGKSGQLFVEAVFTNLSAGTTYVGSTVLIPYKSMKLADPEIEVAVTEDAERFMIHLRAKKYAAFVQLDFTEMDAVFGENFFHMTRPEHTVYLYKHNLSNPEISIDELKRQLVIRSLFDSYRLD